MCILKRLKCCSESCSKSPNNGFFDIKHVKTVEIFHDEISKLQMLVYEFQCESNSCIRKAHFLPGICSRPRHVEFWRENTTCGDKNCSLLNCNVMNVLTDCRYEKSFMYVREQMDVEQKQRFHALMGIRN